MRYTFRPMTERDARLIATWRYDGPYAFYDLSPEELEELLDPAMAYFAVDGEEGDLVGFFGYGPAGQAPGGHRAGVYGDDALDIGLGLRPDLTGRGLGLGFVEAGLAFGQQRYSPRGFRLSVAAFNQRAIRAYQRAGFVVGPRFTSPVNGVETDFLLMTRPERTDNGVGKRSGDQPDQPVDTTARDER